MKKIFAITLFFILSLSKGFAQNIDSLKLALKNAKHDTTRVKILSELTQVCETEDILTYNEPCLKLCEKNLQNSKLASVQKLFFKKHLADALNTVGFIYNNQSDNHKALEYYSKSLKIQEEIKNNEGIATSLNNIGLIYDNQGDAQKALEYYHKSLKIQNLINDKQGIATSLNNIGFVYYNQGDDQKALEYYHKSLKIDEELKNKQGISSTFNNIGLIYDNQGNIPKALEYHHKSLKIKEEINDKQGVANSLNNIGLIYDNQGETQKALEYYHKCLKITEETNDKQGIAISLNNIGTIYDDQGDNTKALEYHLKSLKIREEINDKRGIANSLNNIGFIYDIQGDVPKALEYYHKSLKIDEELKNKKGVVISLVNISDAMLLQGQVDVALDYAKRSITIAKELGYPEQIKQAATNLKKIYQKQNKFKEAFEMFELEILMRDSINNAETKKASIRKQFQYQYEKKAAADSVKNAEEQKVKNAQLSAQTAQIKQERIQRYALFSGLILVIAFSGFVYNRFRLSQRQKKIIELQKNEVDNAYEMLHEKNKEITDSITYAKRLQQAILPPTEFIKTNFPESFILYKPKDIVAGDFYWAEKIDDLFFIAAADCTGHGVPGAMVSVVCSNALNRSVNEFGLTNTGKILDKTRELVIQTFEKSNEEVKDGMDISLLCIDKRNQKVFWSGANNPLWFTQNTVTSSYSNPAVTSSEVEKSTDSSLDSARPDNNLASATLIEIKADKQPVGKSYELKPFTSKEIEYKSNTIFYLFTDGLADQFGGPKGKKFKYKQFEEILISIKDKTMQEQSEFINNKFEEWKGDLEQVDDVCVIGIKI